jgi:hypothetical protein
MSISDFSRAGQSRCSGLQPHRHYFCLDIFKLLIGPPLVSQDVELLPLFFRPSTRNFSSIYKKIMKLFICTHESYQLH